MERFVHNANLEHFRKLLSESESDPLPDEERHKMLLWLFAEEKVKDLKAKQPLDS